MSTMAMQFYNVYRLVGFFVVRLRFLFRVSLNWLMTSWHGLAYADDVILPDDKTSSSPITSMYEWCEGIRFLYLLSVCPRIILLQSKRPTVIFWAWFSFIGPCSKSLTSIYDAGRITDSVFMYSLSPWPWWTTSYLVVTELLALGIA